MENKILEKLQGRLMRKIDLVEKNIVTYKEKFGEDYEKFLMWYAEDLYKSKQTLGYYNSLLTAVETDDMSFVKESLRIKVESLSEDLLHGSLRRSSTNSFANLIHVLDLEVKQTIISTYSVLLREIEEMEKQSNK